MMCTSVTFRAINTARAGRRLAALGGLLALAGAATAETSITSNNAHSTDASSRSVVSAKADKSLNNMRAEKAKLVSGDEGAIDAFYLKQVGPVADRDAEKGLNQFEQAVFCGICDFDATTSLETALPAAWSEYGDAFFNRSDAVAGKWLRDQGCFVIAACAGVTNPANKLRMPIAFDYTASLPNFKVCGFISNFNAPNDPGTASSLFTIKPDFVTGNTFTPSPACGTFTPTLQNNQRDRDMISFKVPAGGITNFRLFITGGQEFIASLGVNKNFPNPGDINSCWTDGTTPPSNNPPAEFGFIAVIGGDRSATNPDSTTGDGPEGAINSTWVYPRGGTTTLPEGTYLINIQLKAFASLVPPSTPTPPSTRYQIQVVGTPAAVGVGACCTVGNNGCTDNQTNAQCDTANGVWRGANTTCAAVNAGTVPCNIGTCVGTAEGPSRDCPAASDQNLGCVVANSTLFDFINPGETICGFSGGNIVGTVDDTDEDWFFYENTSGANQNVKFTLDTEHRSAFQFFYAGPDGNDPCTGVSGFGFNPGEPVRNSTIEVCIRPGQQVFCRLVPAEIPLPCGNPAGPAYRLTLTTAACNQVACCSLAGVCSSASGLDCYAAGGISLGEGSTCANSTCCSGTAVCTGSTVTENALPRVNSTGSSDVCITSANFATFVDSFNGGCENTAASFSNANVGQKVCGTLNAFALVGDTDWYQVTTIGNDAYLGVILKGQMDMDVELYKKPTGVVCPATFADLAPNLLQSGSYTACDSTSTIIGDCLPAGTYYIRVVCRFSNFYDVPCAGNAPAANYLMEIFQGVCTGTAVSCTGANENEVLCQNTNSNGGCNTEPTPNFGALACNGTVCGTADYLAGIRDTDWYQISHPGGAFTVNFQSAFYGSVTIAKPGNTGPAGCDNLTVVDGRDFINPNTPTTFTVASLAAGTYWVIVAPDFDGTKRVCCASGSNYRLNVACTPACACFFDLVGNDCIVNVSDLTAFLGQFGKPCSAIVGKCADGNNDGVVNVNDLTAFLGQFGKNGNVNPGVCQ
jgi:hypothetical protein